MRVHFLAFTAFVVASGCYSPPTLAPDPLVSGNYLLDPEHTSVIWSVSHVGLSNYSARFDRVTGTLSFDRENPENSEIDIRIDPASVSTGLPDFDATIANDSGYFNAGEFPEIRFVSKTIDVTGLQTGDVHGELTFRGQTAPLTLSVKFNGAGKSFGHPGDTLGFSASAKLDRTDWGLTKLKNFGIGEIVTLRIETEFNETQN